MLLRQNIIFNTFGEILNEEHRYYQNLYTSTCTNPNDTCFDDFLKRPTLPKLTSQFADTCDGFLTKEECHASLKEFSWGKSPGTDGLTAEFYLNFWELLGQELVHSLNYAFEIGELSISQKRGIITLIPKKDKNKDFLFDVLSNATTSSGFSAMVFICRDVASLLLQISIARLSVSFFSCSNFFRVPLFLMPSKRRSRTSESCKHEQKVQDCASVRSAVTSLSMLSPSSWFLLLNMYLSQVSIVSPMNRSSNFVMTASSFFLSSSGSKFIPSNNSNPSSPIADRKAAVWNSSSN